MVFPVPGIEIVQIIYQLHGRLSNRRPIFNTPFAVRTAH
jgi:hypothetical protein